MLAYCVIDGDMSPQRVAQCDTIMLAHGAINQGTVAHDGRAVKYSIPDANVTDCKAALVGASFHIINHGNYFDITSTA